MHWCNQRLRFCSEDAQWCVGDDAWCVLPLQGFHLGDSAKHEQKRTWQTFFADVERCKALETPWTLELRDPLANSFVSSVLEDPRKDPRMQVKTFRSAIYNWEDAMVLQLCHGWGQGHQQRL